MRIFRAFANQLMSGDVVLALVLILGASWLTCRLLRQFGGRDWPFLSGGQQLSAQLTPLLLLEQGYEFTRAHMTPVRTDVAFLNAYRLLGFEWRHGFFIESKIERYVLQFPTLMAAADLFYVIAHVALTIGVLAWVYVRRRQNYPMLRNLLVVTTAFALVAFYVFPTAPPRLLTNYGLIDPLVAHHLLPPGGAEPGSLTYNPYAAMPSLHVAYAFIVGWALLKGGSGYAVRAFGTMYPLAMTVTVVVTGNHWLVDVAGAICTVLLSALVLTLIRAILLFVRVPHRPQSVQRQPAPFCGVIDA